MKFKSSRLKKFDYNIDITFDEAKELSEIVSLADNQILRSIRDITKHQICYDKIELWYLLRDKLKRRKVKHLSSEKIKKYKIRINKLSENSRSSNFVLEVIDKIENPSKIISEQIMIIQNKINRTMFVPDYISIVIEHPKHYEYIHKNGIVINGIKYKRFSCSAGQARVSTVILCNENIILELKQRLNNGRNPNGKIVPSKFNAYFGLAGSATYKVSEPKFIVVKDFINQTTFNSNFVTETPYDEDDIISEKIITIDMNRTDGMGLISVEQSKLWAEELGLDWIPSQWCFRQNFIKGMLCTFSIHEFCKEKNNGNYIVESIYKDNDGNYIKVDLRNYSVILTESQFKLWDQFSSVEEYINNYHKNKLYWGISQYTPKEPKDILRLNYQFIQALDLSRDDIEQLASQFVNWINGVSYDNFPYMLLFLLGVNNDEKSIKQYISNGDNYWIKSLIVNPDLKNDKYFSNKIYGLIKKRIQNGCLGEILTDGNFQVLVYDPFGLMQHVCGLEVTGLLKENEFYSNYWNKRNIKQVDGMRSPLTFRAEHVLLNLRNDEEVNKWYKYCNNGIILNYHGHEVVNFGGADTDFDILATTSNQQMINGIYKDELPVVYTPPTPDKIIFTDDDLYLADTFSFGSIIGQITNKSSNAYSLLPVLEELYGKDSREYKVTYSRIQQCCKAQSAQIDKAKIGKEVKGIPKLWIEKRKINVDNNGEVLDDEETVRDKNFYNSILINKYPYFFKYRYNSAKTKYNDFYDYTDITCHQRFKMSLDELILLKNKNEEQIEFINSISSFSPLIDSDSPMNLLCKYIESINFNVKQKIKINNTTVYSSYKNNNIKYSDDLYRIVIDQLLKYINGIKFNKLLSVENNDDDFIKADCEYELSNTSLEDYLNKFCSNVHQVVNCLVDYFYIYNPKSNKDIMWNTYGKYLYNNVKRNYKHKVKFPLPDINGDILYLGKAYSMREIKI
jgi:hypothetical protein